MLKVNNFDTNSQGQPCEFSLGRDEELAYELFQENVQILSRDFRGEIDTAALTLGEESFYLFDLQNWNIRDGKKLFSDFCKHMDYLSYSEVSNIIRHFDVSLRDKLTSVWEVVYHLLEDYNGDEEVENFLRTYYTPTFIEYESRGHSQGDFATVYIPEYLHKKDKEIEKHLYQYIDNLFWEHPIYGELETQRKNIDLTEMLTNEYVYDKETLLSNLKPELSKIEFNFVSDSLPEYLYQC
mgnify:CR=1 FL=1